MNAASLASIGYRQGLKYAAYYILLNNIMLYRDFLNSMPSGSFAFDLEKIFKALKIAKSKFLRASVSAKTDIKIRRFEFTDEIIRALTVICKNILTGIVLKATLHQFSLLLRPTLRFR